MQAIRRFMNVFNPGSPTFFFLSKLRDVTMKDLKNP